MLKLDSMYSAVTKIGTAMDRSESYSFVDRAILTVPETEAMFNSFDVAHTLCSIVPEEALAPGWCLSDPAVEDTLEDLKALEILTDAAIMARVHGDCLVYMYVEDGADSEADPLEEGAGEIKFLRKIERHYLSPLTFYEDPLSPKFGEPETYQVNSGNSYGVVVHETRFLKFYGARTSDLTRRNNNMWHCSVLQPMYTVLRDFGASWASVPALLQQSVQGTYKLKGLAELLAAPGNEAREQISKRVELIDLGRSVLRSVILDADGEDFSYQVAPLTSLPELLDRFASRVAAAADGIPVSKLFGISPAGLNATGIGDAKNWVATLDRWRKTRVAPELERLLEVMGADVDVSWPDLEVLSALENAQKRSLIAASDVAMVGQGVLASEEVAQARFSEGGGGFDKEIQIDAQENRPEQDYSDDTESVGKAAVGSIGPDAGPVSGESEETP